MKFRNYKTSEVANGHQIGITKEGFPLFQGADGWEPLFFHYNDEDGNPVLLPYTEKIIQKCAENWLSSYKGESLNKEWFETAWNGVPCKEQEWTSWIEFHAAITERIESLER